MRDAHETKILPLGGQTTGPDREPVTHAVGERATYEADQVAVANLAFKPERLFILDARSWLIHDVRVNGRSQLDGDELDGGLFCVDSLSASAIASGFDQIVPGGSFEIDYSFRGHDDALAQWKKILSLNPIGHAARAPFRGCLLGKSIDQLSGVNMYSGPIRLRGRSGELVATWWEGNGQARVPPQHEARFVVTARDQSFQVENIAIERRPADWEVVDVRVGDRSQFSTSGVIPGEYFSVDAPDDFVGMVVAPGQRIEIRVRYVGSDPRGGRFGAVLRGRAGDRTPAP